MLALPDRHRFLERVDAEPRGLERFGPVRRGRHDRDRRFGERQVADAVQQREPLDDGPAARALGRDRGQPAHRLLFVGLVGDARARRRVLRSGRGRRPRNTTTAPADARRRPRRRGVDGQRLERDGDPVAAGGREHGGHRSEARSPALKATRRELTIEAQRPRRYTPRDVGPAGDESASSDERRRPTPDPLDRPWVHPSELHSFVANPLPAPVQRPPAGMGDRARLGRRRRRRHAAGARCVRRPRRARPFADPAAGRHQRRTGPSTTRSRARVAKRWHRASSRSAPTRRATPTGRAPASRCRATGSSRARTSSIGASEVAGRATRTGARSPPRSSEPTRHRPRAARRRRRGPVAPEPELVDDARESATRSIALALGRRAAARSSAST